MAKKKTTVTKTNLERPPIVAVLGHVDHGKTTLLDTIRKTNIAKGEHGGITQHIGAYQVEVDSAGAKRLITFIDTPGHEAFSKMRSRGSSVTDLVILVISAVEGVQPQTEESIRHIQEAKVPFIVAATKMDLPDASLDRVKKHLSKVGVLTEGYGGEIVVVPVSSVSKEGISNLLEMILLVSEMIGIKGKESDPFKGVIIESKLDRKKGPLVTILVKKGIIKQGDDIYLGTEKTRIRALFDQFGIRVASAKPSTPVEVLGFKEVPMVGATLTSVVENEQIELKSQPSRTHTPTQDNQLPIILKADTKGSLEAILGKLDNTILVIEASVGDISESEIMMAKTSKAFVIGFSVRISKQAQLLAEEEKVLIKTYTIIYHLLDEIYEVKDLVLEGQKEEVLGKGKVMEVFVTSQGRIAGVKVISGRLTKGDKVRLVRSEEEIGMGRILELRQGKDSVNTVNEGMECGAKISSNLDFSASDMIVSVKVTEIKI